MSPPPASVQSDATAGGSDDPASHATASRAAAPVRPTATVPSASNTESYPASFFAQAQPATANDMIARLPGFTFDDGGGVRGYGGAAGNVLIDGKRPASKSDDLRSVLVRIPAGQVERIDIIRGGAPGIDMQGKAVVANVVRRRGAASTLAVTLTQQLVTSDGRYVAVGRIESTHATADDRIWGWSVQGGREFDDSTGSGTRRAFTGAGSALGEASDREKGDGTFLNLAGNYAQPALGGTIRVTLSGQFEDFTDKERVGAITGYSPASDETDRQRSRTGEIGVNFTRAFGPTLSSETVLLQQIVGQDYDAAIAAGVPADVQLFRQRHTQTESIARETLTWTASPKLTVEGGGEGDYNRLVSRSVFTDDGVVQDLPAADVVVDELRGEAFAKATINPVRYLTLEVGAREEVSRIGSTGDVRLTKTLSYFKPRALATWTIHGDDQLRVRLEREVAQLDFNDFVATSSFSTGQVRAGNPDLVPQRTDIAEATFEKHFARRGAAVVTYRHSWIHDALDRAPVFGDGGVFDAPANIGRGSRDEVVGNLTLPLGGVGLKDGLLTGDATWRHSAVIDPTTGMPRRISGLYPFDGSLTLSEDIPRRKLSLSATLHSGHVQTYYYFNQIEADRVRPYGSVQITYRPSRPLTVQLLAYDIGQTHDRRIYDWAVIREEGGAADREDRRLALGPTLQLRLRRDW